MNIYDIAEKAGISIATVSRVLNQNKSVSEKTRKKVLDAIKELGYTPNVFARGLGLGSMRMIGVLCTDVSDLYYAKAVSVVENALRLAGYDSILCCTGTGIVEKKERVMAMLAKKVDALVLIGSIFREKEDNSHLQKAAEQVPVVVVNGLIELPNVYCVLCDERSAMRELVAQLVKEGRKRVLYLHDADTYSDMQKLKGYEEGLQQGGQAATLAFRTDYSDHAAEQLIRELLEKEPIDGIVTSCDLLAMGAMRALMKAGKEIPRETVVIGFDNSVLAGCGFPALTSVDNRVELLCTAAVDLLHQVFDGQGAPSKVIYEAELVCRDTYQPLNASCIGQD